MTNDSTVASPPVQQSTWPRTLGIVGIVWAAFGLVCNFSNLGSEEISGPYTVVSFVAGLVTSVWLLVGSRLLLRRSPAARSVLLSWSVVELITIVALTLWGFMYTDQMVELLKSEMQEAAASMDGDGPLKAMIYALSIGTAVVLSIIPLWVLLAMRNPAKRAEIEGWGDAG